MTSLLQFFGGLLGVVKIGDTLFCDTCRDVRTTLSIRQYEAYKASDFTATACRSKCGGMLRNPMAEVRL